MCANEVIASGLSRFIDIAAAKAEFGETEHAYFRVPVVFSCGRRRGDEKHFISGTKIPCTKEEFDANVKEGDRLNEERFRVGSSKFRRDYSLWHKQIMKPGWKEQLIKMIMDES